MDIACLFGHDKIYIGIKDAKAWQPMMIAGSCPHGFSDWERFCASCNKAVPRGVQVARWQCRYCSKLGEITLATPHIISYGKLIPDSKRWANFE